MDELGVWAASPVDAASLFGLGAHFWRQLTDADHLVSLPVTPLVYKDAEFRLEGGLDARRAAVLAEFSELANRVPTHPVWTPPVTPHLWDVYGEVLAADLARSSLTPEERTRYDAAIDYLYDPDPATGDPVPSAALRAYRAARQTWTDADREYRRAEDAAWMSTDPAARDRWARIEEPDLRQKRDDAMDAWQTAGRKAEVEDALRESSELAAKSPSATWKRHRDAFNPNAPGQFSTAPNGLLYAPTYYSPSAALDTPWTEVRLTRELFLTLADQAPAAFSAALGHRATDHSVSQLAFEYRVVSVVRPWLDPPMDLFGSRAWRFSSGVRELSDGGDPPKGRCPSYVESIALARNVHLTREAHTYSPAAVAENNWPPMGTFDFDTGRMNVGMDQASVRWEWTGDGTGAQLVPGTDTGIAALGTVDYDTLDGRALDRLRYRDAPVPGTGLAPGSVFAVRTRRKKLVKIQVLAYGPELAIRDQEYELTASSMVASDTAPDDVFIAAFACRRLPKSPDPDGGVAVVSDWLLLGLDTVYAVRLGADGEQMVARVQPTSALYRTARELYGGAAELTFRVSEDAPCSGELFFGRMDMDAESLGQMTVELRKILYREPPPAPQEGLRYLLFGDDQLFLWHLPGSFEQGLRVRFAGWESPVLGVDEVVTVEASGRGSDVTERLAPGEQVAAMGAELMVAAEVYLRVARG